MKRQRYTTPKSGQKEETKIENIIFLKTECGRELRQWAALIRRADFPTNLKIQNKASLLARGIVIKVRVLTAEAGDDKVLFEMASAIVRDFGGMFNRRLVNLQPPQKPEEILMKMLDSEGARVICTDALQHIPTA